MGKLTTDSYNWQAEVIEHELEKNKTQVDYINLDYTIFCCVSIRQVFQENAQKISHE